MKWNCIVIVKCIFLDIDFKIRTIRGLSNYSAEFLVKSVRVYSALKVFKPLHVHHIELCFSIMLKKM